MKELESKNTNLVDANKEQKHTIEEQQHKIEELEELHARDADTIYNLSAYIPSVENAKMDLEEAIENERARNRPFWKKLKSGRRPE